MKKMLFVLLLTACSNTTDPIFVKDQGNADANVEDTGPDLSDNRAPFAFDLSLDTLLDRQIDCTLDGKDPDGDMLTFEVIGSPENGTLIGDIPNLKYKPNLGFVGRDAFSFRTSDGTLFSEAAEVQIRVTAPDGKPVLTILEPSQNSVFGSSISLTFSATAIDDEDGDISVDIKWESNIDGPLGEGGSVPAQLSIGKHFVRAEVVDEGGTVVSTTVNVEIIQSFPTRILGSVGNEEAGGIGVDEVGNIYIAGSTDNTLTGINRGGRDGFLVKYDKDGAEIWRKSIAGSGDDEINQLSLDAAGNIFLVGTTTGSIDQGILRGGSDAFVIKHDPSGNVLWSKQFGTSDDDQARGLYIDNATGELYVVGDTYGSLESGIFIPNQDLDGFIRKFATNGQTLWTQQLQNVGKQTYDSVRIGKNRDGDLNVYVTGNSSITTLNNPIPNNQLLVLEYTQSGTEVLVRSIGNQDDEFSAGIAEGNDGKLYNGFSSNGFTGSTRGGFDAHIRDITDVGFDYKRNWGGEGDDIINDIVGLDGQLYVIGQTDNNFEENGVESHAHIGGQDIFIAAFTTEVGGISWRHIIGNTSDNIGRRIAARDGFIYILSTTQNGFENEISLGGSDLLIVQYDTKGTRF